MSVRSHWDGANVSVVVRGAARQGLLAGAKHVRDASQRVAPSETRELRESAYAEVDPSSLIAIVGYDVPRDIKAIKQHEDLSYAHPSGEQAKFLEKPLRDSAGAVQSEISKSLRRVL
ncbi:hypothetical protein [Timonella sp. A28]|uniref:hypothetical protein n=1 Tax=Timonella sp. A28 TaxID=3442640 RepID=UPI003EC149B0